MGDSTPPTTKVLIRVCPPPLPFGGVEVLHGSRSFKPPPRAAAFAKPPPAPASSRPALSSQYVLLQLLTTHRWRPRPSHPPKWITTLQAVCLVLAPATPPVTTPTQERSLTPGLEGVHDEAGSPNFRTPDLA